MCVAACMNGVECLPGVPECGRRCRDNGPMPEDDYFGPGDIPNPGMPPGVIIFRIIKPTNGEAIDAGNDCFDGTTIALNTVEEKNTAQQFYLDEDNSIINVRCDKAITVESCNVAAEATLSEISGLVYQQWEIQGGHIVTAASDDCNLALDVFFGQDGSTIVLFSEENPENAFLDWELDEVLSS